MNYITNTCIVHSYIYLSYSYVNLSLYDLCIYIYYVIYYILYIIYCILYIYYIIYHILYIILYILLYIYYIIYIHILDYDRRYIVFVYSFHDASAKLSFRDASTSFRACSQTHKLTLLWLDEYYRRLTIKKTAQFNWFRNRKKNILGFFICY